MAVIVSANFGRGVHGPEFRRNVQAVKSRFRDRAIIGCQEIDEADEPDEHEIVKQIFGPRVDFAGWKTHVPIVVPRPFDLKRQIVTPVAAGLERQSPARQVVEAEIVHSTRKNLDPVVHLNVHFPRRSPKLASRRKDTLEGLEARVNYWWERKRTIFITSDTNGVSLSKVHPRFKRIGGSGIDWIGLIEHPKGTQVEVQETGIVDLTIDGHNAHWVQVALHNPAK